MATELDLGSIDVTPYRDFSGGIPDDHEPDPIGEFMARGIVAERGADGTYVESDAHRIARKRIDRITGYQDREASTTISAREFLNEMEYVMGPPKNKQKCTRCGKLLIFDILKDRHVLPTHSHTLCYACAMSDHRNNEIQLEPEAKRKGVNKSIKSFLTLGNIIEGRPLPTVTHIDDISFSDYYSRYSSIDESFNDLRNNTFVYDDYTNSYFTMQATIDDYLASTWTIITSSSGWTASSNNYYDSFTGSTTVYRVNTPNVTAQMLIPATEENSQVVNNLIDSEIDGTQLIEPIEEELSTSSSYDYF